MLHINFSKLLGKEFYICFIYFKKIIIYQINIIFPDAPTPPQDIEVTDIFQTSCKIKWKVPVDNGGSPVIHYVIERQDLSVKGNYIVIQSKSLN